MNGLLKLMVAAVLVAVSGNSAKGESHEEKRFTFGATVGLVKTNPGALKESIDNSEIDMYPFKSGYGYDFGGFARFRIVYPLYIEAGLNCNYSAFSVKNYFAGIEENPVDHDETTGIDIRRMGLRIPVRVGIQLSLGRNVRFILALGPQFRIGLQSRAHTTMRFVDGSTQTTETNLYDKSLPTPMRRSEMFDSFTLGLQWRHIRIMREWIWYKDGNIFASKRYHCNANQSLYSLSYIF